MYDGTTVSCACRERHPVYVYVSLGNRRTRDRVRLRLCKACGSDLLDTLEEHSVDGENASESFRKRPDSCDYNPSCEQYPTDQVLFATHYFPDGERCDRAARLCEEHLANARQNFIWSV